MDQSYLDEEWAPWMEVCQLLCGVELVLDADLPVGHGGHGGPARRPVIAVLDEGGGHGGLVRRHLAQFFGLDLPGCC